MDWLWLSSAKEEEGKGRGGEGKREGTKMNMSHATGSETRGIIVIERPDRGRQSAEGNWRLTLEGKKKREKREKMGERVQGAV